MTRIGTITALLLATLVLPGCGSVATETYIEASPSDVWAVISNAAGYAQWNPVLVKVEGQYAQGAKMQNQVAMPPNGDIVEIRSRVIVFETNRRLVEQGGTFGLLRFVHHWELTPVGTGTKLVQREEYSGIGVLFWDYKQMTPVYARANAALKTFMEGK